MCHFSAHKGHQTFALIGKGEEGSNLIFLVCPLERLLEGFCFPFLLKAVADERCSPLYIPSFLTSFFPWKCFPCHLNVFLPPFLIQLLIGPAPSLSLELPQSHLSTRGVQMKVCNRPLIFGLMS